jgi:broad specificity phosphatase PhoE
MQVVLLRHGATDWNLQGRCQGASDIELNDVGLRQAETIAAYLSHEKIDAVYSSHLKRAMQTAHVVSRPHGLPVNIEEDVRELDHGDLEGLTFDEIKKNYADFLARWRVEPAELQIPGGERLADVYQRAWKGLERIVERHDTASTVIVVSHNFPILGIICRITNTHLNKYRSFRLDPCGVTRLSYFGGENWTVTQINNKNFDSQPPLQNP